MNAIATEMFPKHATQVQKRYLHWVVRKPGNIHVHECASCITNVNNYLEDFPPKVETKDEGNQVVTPVAILPLDKILTHLNTSCQLCGSAK